jgi:DNA-binding Lrp family transcriptional regulator
MTPVYGSATLLIIAAAAVAVLLVLIIVLRMHAFVALVLVSFGTAIAAGVPLADVPVVAIAAFSTTLGTVALLVGLGVMIGRILEVSEHTVRARLKRLEDSGLIKIHAQVDPNATNGAQELAYVALRAQNSQVQHLIDEMVDRPEFWTVDRTVGEYNVLALAHAGTREQLADIVDEIRSAPGIERSETWALSSLQLSAFPWGRF